MKMALQNNSRAVAADMIARWMETGDFPDRMMNRVRADRGFVMEVVYGTVKWKRELEWVLKQCMKQMPAIPLRAHMMVGLYQILHMDSVESYAAVNETVAAVKAVSSQTEANFTNAVLRRVLREKAEVITALNQQPSGIRLSHPEILVKRWIATYGNSQTDALCNWNNQRAAVILRINTTRIQMADFRDRVMTAGMKVEPHPMDPSRFCTLGRGVSVEDLPGFEDGWFMVQDPSTIMAVEMLAPKPQERILDACAAPGGKTVAMAEAMGGGGTLTAMDIHADRMGYLHENLTRMGFSGVRVIEGDMTSCKPGGEGVPALSGLVFDGILLDVPCMNTGVLQRRADARWRFATDRLGSVCATQRAILDGAATRLRIGGRLVYSTCSLETEEDEALVAGWVKDNPNFELVREKKLFPPTDGTDGAYAALLKRIS
ncbi:MAG: 16S rRNA (cytosine(967)-C(5))-methyltransferase RsmB [bacterium]|jgi:16S rRNA (cytosine967-C5)-methyltransferase